MRKALVAAVALAAAAVAADIPITTKTINETKVASVRFQGQYTDVGKYMEELRAAVGDKDAGPYFALYYDGPEVPVHDIEVCVPVKGKVVKGDVKTREFEGGTYARTLHLGPYENIAGTWTKLGAFVGMNNLSAVGPSLEVYDVWDGENPANNVTEVLMPVSKPVEAATTAGAAPAARVVHFEIPAVNPERAAAFYAKAFGWKIEKWEGVDYWLCYTGAAGPGIDGAIYKRAAPTDGVKNALGVADLDASVRAVEDAGGKIVAPKVAVLGVGWLAYAMDTEGNVFGIMQFDPTAK